MSDKEYKELLEYHLTRAAKAGYDALTVETKVLRRAYEDIKRRYASNGYREDQESEGLSEV